MDNQYREAPQQAPFTLGPTEAPSLSEMERYREGLLDQVANLDPVTAARYREDLIDYDTREQIASWNIQRVEDQPNHCLRELITLVENYEDAVKAGIRL